MALDAALPRIKPDSMLATPGSADSIGSRGTQTPKISPIPADTAYSPSADTAYYYNDLSTHHQ